MDTAYKRGVLSRLGIEQAFFDIGAGSLVAMLAALNYLLPVKRPFVFSVLQKTYTHTESVLKI